MFHALKDESLLIQTDIQTWVSECDVSAVYAALSAALLEHDINNKNDELDQLADEQFADATDSKDNHFADEQFADSDADQVRDEN